MFIAIYTFKVKPGCEKDLESSWENLTRLIYKYEGSLGSRLHLNNDGRYVAYAQWPDKTTWDKAGEHLPPQATDYRKQMRESCEEIKTAFELDVINDLITNSPYSSEDSKD